MHPTLEQWAARVPDNPDPAAPETRQRWQVAISRISQKSSFTLREGYQEYESDGNIQGSLYEDDFRLGKQLFIVTDEEFAKLEGGSFQPLMETLWNRYGSKDRGEWEEIGTQYSFDEGRTGQVLKENTNLTTVVFDEEVFLPGHRGVRRPIPNRRQIRSVAMQASNTAVSRLAVRRAERKPTLAA